MQQYNQWKGAYAVCLAALRSIFRSPQAVFFSLFFPMVLIAIFGALSGGGGPSFDIAFDKASDTTSYIFQIISNGKIFDIHHGSEGEINEDLKKGRITAILNIVKTDTGSAKYLVQTRTSSAAQKEFPTLQNVINGIINSVEISLHPAGHPYARLATPTVVEGRRYKMIDFFLPGMLGFSLIGSAVFGVAFLFFSLRETLVLKRMYSTPIKKGYIVFGESIARVLFQLVTAVVIILFGTYFYGFTLAHGAVTFFEMLVLCLLGLLVFMGVGFIISSVSKNQNVIPIYANLFMFPQYFLSGTFFQKSLLPQSMQGVIKFLPLTPLNDGLRKLSFEGLHLYNLGSEILILVCWCVVVFAIAIRVFRWEQ
jgi:ABC-2 type transport system permease protein